MNYETFVDRVAQRAGLPADQATILTRATLETLAERLTAGEALDLAAQLPKRLQVPLRPRQETAERFSLAEFGRRAGERAGVDERAAANGIRAVFATLREAVTGGEFEDLLTQLPADFAEVAEPVAVRSGRPR
jgi:uncharacterized protein (DUF2267 family)